MGHPSCAVSRSAVVTIVGERYRRAAGRRKSQRGTEAQTPTSRSASPAGWRAILAYDAVIKLPSKSAC